MKKNIIIIILSIIALLLAGTVGYLIAEKVVSSKYENGSKDNVENKHNSDKDNIVIEKLDLSKCLNTTHNYNNSSDEELDLGVVMSINSDKRSVRLSINWDRINSLGYINTDANGIKDYQITGFTKDIVDTFIGGVGQSIGGTILFYLLEDGTIEYTFISEIKYDSQTFLRKTVSNVDSVIKLYTADVTTGYTGWVSTIGSKADGSFYDLGEIIMNEKNK